MFWLWWHNRKKEHEEIEFLIKENNFLKSLIWRLMRIVRRKHHKVKLAIISISYNNLKTGGIIMSQQLDVKTFVTGTLGVVKHDDGSAIDATFAGETFTSDNEAVATVSVDPGDGPDTAILDIAGVSVGEANITVTAAATYIDPNTGKSVTKTLSAVVGVTVTQPVTDAETDLVVTLGAPQPSPVV